MKQFIPQEGIKDQPPSEPELSSKYQKELEKVKEITKKKSEAATKKYFKAKKNKIKNGYVTAWFLRSNKIVDARAVQIGAELITDPITGNKHKCDVADIFYYKNKPLIVVPEWSIVPLNPTEHKERSDNKGFSPDPQKVAIKACEMSNDLVKKGTGLDAKKLVFIGVIILVALYFLKDFISGGGI